MTEQKKVEVVVPDKFRLGTFANAFRIVPDTGDEVYLDFCVYSEQEKQADIVARIRVHKSFLPSIRDRIGKSLMNVSQVQDVAIKGMVH
jgi:hypothetical protein